MKKVIIIISIWIGACAYAQQLPQQTQYMFNQYSFNPAYAGVTDSWETVMNNRYQWLGIVDAPRTFTMTAQGPFKNEKMGIGGAVYTDIVGPTRRLGFQTSFSYHVKLTDEIKLSMAVSVGFNEWLIDADKITTIDPDDPFFASGLVKTFSPDGKFGMYLYHDSWYFGIATPQLFRSKLKFKDKISLSDSYLVTHFYINGGYRYQLNQDFELEPTMLLKVGGPAPLKLDINIRTLYKKKVWLGVGYRLKDAVTTMIGYQHEDKLLIGYAFDFTTSSLNSYNSGTHEVFFTVKFGKTKASAASVEEEEE